MTTNRHNWLSGTKFISADTKYFIDYYDLSLTRYMLQYRFDKHENFTSSMPPDEITKIEKDFIQSSVQILKSREEENQIYIRKLFEQFSEENEVTPENYDDDMHLKWGDYYEEKLPTEIKTETGGFRMKMNFLVVKANKIGCLIDLEKDFSFEEPEPNVPHSLVDLSHTKATEKLIYLNELGVIDFLRQQKPFSFSINKLATVLSAITDENVTTLQPALNSMLSSTNSPEKNPYYSKRAVPKVKASLVNLGFFEDRE